MRDLRAAREPTLRHCDTPDSWRPGTSRRLRRSRFVTGTKGFAVRSPPVVPPVQPEFHPEFGYLWPASHTRRIMRIGLFATVFGAMIGGITAITMTHRNDPDAERVQAAR